MNILKIEGYSFKTFAPTMEAQAVVDSCFPGTNDEVRVLVYSSPDAEMVRVRPGEHVALPASVDGKETIVTIAGQAPTLCADADRFDGLDMTLPENAAVAVTFYSKKNPLGKKKVFTTLM